MSGKTLDLNDIIEKDQLGCAIAEQWVSLNTSRQPWITEIQEIRKYLFATDTTQTTNSKLPWKNKTTTPKMTQIRDNLLANYLASCFPKRKWMNWLANRQSDASVAKREAILAYMSWVISQPHFKTEMTKCILDYIDTGNVFGTVDWMDQRVDVAGKIQTGYVGPRLMRVSPMDIVMNPVAPTFVESPKIVRSLISMGELKKLLQSQTPTDKPDAWKELWEYFTGYRSNVRQSGYDLHVVDGFLKMDGFDSFRAYLMSDYVEILTFYGDLFDHEKNELLENHIVMVVDRHKILSKQPNPSFFGYAPIFHCGWRPRQDNLWAMGPLSNLVGMQYRLDHIENLKADVFDLIAFPVLKIKGYVNEFEWGPMQRIVTDAEGDVEMLAPPFQILQANEEKQIIMATMEEMAGAPREAMGIRSPGEKTALEVQKLENAASRLFQNKIRQFEEQFIEPILNAMLELARRMIHGTQEINVFDDDFKIQVFMELSADDITGAGTLKPIAARHFAERAEMLQNIAMMYQSVGQDQMVLQHFSSIQTAKMLEETMDLGDWEIVQPFVRISEMAEAQQLQNAGEEQTMMALQQPSGLSPGDSDEELPPEEELNSL